MGNYDDAFERRLIDYFTAEELVIALNIEVEDIIDPLNEMIYRMKDHLINVMEHGE